MYQPYVRFANPQITLDATAKNPVGCLYSPPANQGLPLTTLGFGAQPVFKYVFFNTAAAPIAQIAPAPVYWTDLSFTTVSANPAEGNGGTVPASFLAGFWMPNTTALGASQTATQWGAQFQQSYGWIQIGGYLASAWLSNAGGVGQYIYGTTATNWATAAGTTPAASTRTVGIQITAVAASVGSVLCGAATDFWGS
jgi:hypothetical protein